MPALLTSSALIASPRRAIRTRATQPTVASYVKVDNPYSDELKATAAYIAQRGKGILASDESNATTGKRLATVGVENTEDNRRDWRQLLYTAPGLGTPTHSGPHSVTNNSIFNRLHNHRAVHQRRHHV